MAHAMISSPPSHHSHLFRPRLRQGANRVSNLLAMPFPLGAGAPPRGRGDAQSAVGVLGAPLGGR
eukprot:683651-Pyramimonas_sp.AAC.1